MDAQYLAQLKDQRAVLQVLLQQQQQSAPLPSSQGVRMTTDIYVEILKDAVTVVSSLIQHLELNSQMKKGEQIFNGNFVRLHCEERSG